MTLIDTIAKSLGAEKRTPSGYVCRCPCHEDKQASLSIAEKDGKLLFNCFAGCTWENIKKELESRNLLLPLVRRKDRYEGATFYVYKDIVGNPLCRKVKLPDKKQWFERLDGKDWRPGLQGMTVPLYNLQAVIAADIVYLCEGEKDAETLITRGLCATTNHAGAKAWSQHLTDQLKGKTVIIIPDNDDAGRKRIQNLTRALHDHVKALLAFIPDGVPEKGDITDWVNNGGDVSTILGRSVMIEKKKEGKQATRDEYFELLEQVLGEPKRCIFNDKLMSKNPRSGLWNPSINQLELVKSVALLWNETRESKFNTSAIQPHFFALEDSKEPEFLVDVFGWDGVDRIGTMASMVTLQEHCGINSLAFEELLKEWCAKVFDRLADPHVQNRILVLQGAQGIGKDSWTSLLVDGFGQFCIPLAIVGEDKDTYLSLHRGLIMKISEFDKTARTEVSTLKDIITAPSTNLRAPYDKDSQLRVNRCSFISSANAEQLLRDSTGNRRFMIFPVEKIDYEYENWDAQYVKEWQSQIISQMSWLSKAGYRASKTSWEQLKEYIELQTPEELGIELVEKFAYDVRNDSLAPEVGRLEVKPSDKKIRDIVSKLAKEGGLKYGTVKNLLQSKIGVFRRVAKTQQRYWVWVVPQINDLDLSSEEGWTS